MLSTLGWLIVLRLWVNPISSEPSFWWILDRYLLDATVVPEHQTWKRIVEADRYSVSFSDAMQCRHLPRLATERTKSPSAVCLFHRSSPSASGCSRVATASSQPFRSLSLLRSTGVNQCAWEKQATSILETSAPLSHLVHVYPGDVGSDLGRRKLKSDFVPRNERNSQPVCLPAYKTRFPDTEKKKNENQLQTRCSFCFRRKDVDSSFSAARQSCRTR